MRASLKLLLTALLVLPASAQNVVSIDASAPSPTPVAVKAQPGSSRNPRGQVIAANSQYLTFDGKPWLPVMGEFHFSRFPEAQWEQEILKMKAAGVQIVASYIIWIHHEQTEGVFDWTGRRDLRHFAELCARHGMYFYPRIGPWAHAETRNGGLPDWVLKNGPTRRNDPIYLKEVDTYFAQIAEQLKGMLWKDGGPVIGLQLENEYRQRGAGGGNEHIQTLKKMAIADGLDVPLYTVTGWDGAAIPLDAALPVFGGYPDAPWDASPHKLAANEVYAFRFDNRSAGNMGALGGRLQSAASVYAGTPFLTAEVGDGIEDTYFRRPIISTDDVASIPTIMLGSGANMMGYYMFHGGRNPEGGDIPLQESQRTGYPTDVPQKSYDFQAPLGEYGQVRESLRRLKLVHYFLNDFGAMLAPMSVHAPAKLPATPSDTAVPRTAARTNGDRGFVFLSNYVRGLDMPERPGFQVQLKLPSGTVSIPEAPIALPAGVYGIWPVNLPIRAGTMRYATAQLFKQEEWRGETWLFFFTLPGVTPEFMLDPAARVLAASSNVTRDTVKSGLRLRVSDGVAADVQLAGGTHLVVLPESEATQVWRTEDPAMLISAPDIAFTDGPTWTIQSTGRNEMDFGVFGSTQPPKNEGAQIHTAVGGGVFKRYHVSIPAVSLEATAKPLQAATAPPALAFINDPSGKPRPTPAVPDEDAFATAGTWELDIPRIPAIGNLSDVFLQISYEGDIARLYRDGHLLDDDFWNGVRWSIGLKEAERPAPTDWRTPERDLTLKVLALPKTFPMYIEGRDQLHFNTDGLAVGDVSVKLIPQYQLVMTAPQ